MGIKTFGAFVVGGLTALGGKVVYDNVIKKNGLDVKIKDAFCGWIHNIRNNSDKKESVNNCSV